MGEPALDLHLNEVILFFNVGALEFVEFSFNVFDGSQSRVLTSMRSMVNERSE
jgi:hypothetical protein